MKFFIFALIAVIAGVAILNFTESPAPTPVPTNSSSQEITNTPHETTTGETSQAESETPTNAVSAGTDVGMEYPETVVTPDQKTKVFEVTGENFKFNLSEIRVQEGDTVVIMFKSTDGFHDFVIDAFNARTEKVRTDGTSQVTFVASKKGTFEYYCSVGSHRVNGMVGKLIVE